MTDESPTMSEPHDGLWSKVKRLVPFSSEERERETETEPIEWRMVKVDDSTESVRAVVDGTMRQFEVSEDGYVRLPKLHAKEFVDMTDAEEMDGDEDCWVKTSNLHEEGEYEGEPMTRRIKMPTMSEEVWFTDKGYSEPSYKFATILQESIDSIEIVHEPDDPGVYYDELQGTTSEDGDPWDWADVETYRAIRDALVEIEEADDLEEAQTEAKLLREDIDDMIRGIEEITED